MRTKKSNKLISPAPAPCQINKEGGSTEENRNDEETRLSSWQIPADIVRPLRRPQQHDSRRTRNEGAAGGLVVEGGGGLQAAGLPRTPSRSVMQVAATFAKNYITAALDAGCVVFVINRVFFCSIKTGAGFVNAR